MVEDSVNPATARTRKRRERLIEDGVVPVKMELAQKPGSMLLEAAALANLPPGRLAATIVERHFERLKRKAKRQGLGEEGRTAA
jgi:hypothetical protein